MAKCTGIRCPMQYGYKVDECNHTDCPYRTEPMTNADRIRAEDDDEMKTEIHAFSLGFKPWCDYHCENEGDDGCDKCIEKWLKQPAE